MSTDQVSNPWAANQSMTDEPGRPGTCRSKVGCDAMEEPCTNRIVPRFSAPTERFSHMKSLTSPLLVQCSSPCTWILDSGLFMVWLRLLENSKRRDEKCCTGRHRFPRQPRRPPRNAAADASARAA